MAENVVQLPIADDAVFETIEQHIESARTELGNAGFAALVSLTDLSIESLDVVSEHVDAARELLKKQR
jgi:hypothetical protein